MKHQYVGDINDYVKYSVLRAVLGAAGTRRLVVSWMLTADDGGGDGRRLAYLRHPDRYRSVDPDLFDELTRVVDSGSRSISAIESSAILRRTSFYPALLEPGISARDRYFEGLWRQVLERDVVFFDPDNGLDVASVRPGGRGSWRYLYAEELAPLQALNAAAIVYQHFPRVQRDEYVAWQLGRLAHALPGFATFAAYSSGVAFLAACPPSLRGGVEAGLRAAVDQWGDRLRFSAS